MVAIEVAAEDFFMMAACRSLHVGRLKRKMANDFLGRLTLAYFLFEIREGFRKEEGCDDRHEKIVEPVAFVQAEGLERRFVKNQDWARWHKNNSSAGKGV